MPTCVQCIFLLLYNSKKKWKILINRNRNAIIFKFNHFQTPSATMTFEKVKQCKPPFTAKCNWIETLSRRPEIDSRIYWSLGCNRIVALTCLCGHWCDARQNIDTNQNAIERSVRSQEIVNSECIDHKRTESFPDTTKNQFVLIAKGGKSWRMWSWISN